MWPGPYGDWGSRKYLLASLDQSLKRMGLEYVDIFYSHRPDPETPLEETMGALDQAVRSGKALYAGISNYDAGRRPRGRRNSARAWHALPHSSAQILDVSARAESGLLDVLGSEGVGGIAFCPLAQGLLTDRYLRAFRPDSRAAKPHGFLKKQDIDEARLAKVRELNELPRERGQSLAQMALAWVLRDGRMTGADRRQPRGADRAERGGPRQPRVHGQESRPNRRDSDRLNVGGHRPHPVAAATDSSGQPAESRSQNPAIFCKSQVNAPRAGWSTGAPRSR